MSTTGAIPLPVSGTLATSAKRDPPSRFQPGVQVPAAVVRMRPASAFARSESLHASSKNLSELVPERRAGVRRSTGEMPRGTRSPPAIEMDSTTDSHDPMTRGRVDQ